MATSIEHYQEAERLLAFAASPSIRGDAVANTVATAQVHATLALAAVTAMRGATTNAGLSVDDGLAWMQAASVECVPSLEEGADGD